MTSAIRPTKSGVVVDVLVQPNASVAEVVGPHGDRIKVRVTVPPERLRANEAVCDLLARVCGVRAATVVAGRTARSKTVELHGADLGTVRRVLLGPSKAP
ncbi:MAG TPA: DUF167 domain-containing protein [Acidimicrobiia bacterium]|nr:DUF167 domain-containing protein [Acidimicrobiia bacterium]